MQAGRLDRRITIQAPTVTKSASGAPVEGWADVATVWAAVNPKSGREYWSAQQRVAELDSVFRIRYRTGVTRQMRIAYGGEYYDIADVAEVGRREGLDILARVRVTS